MLDFCCTLFRLDYNCALTVLLFFVRIELKINELSPYALPPDTRGASQTSQ